jgi:hypothetical protein
MNKRRRFKAKRRRARERRIDRLAAMGDLCRRYFTETVEWNETVEWVESSDGRLFFNIEAK